MKGGGPLPALRAAERRSRDAFRLKALNSGSTQNPVDVAPQSIAIFGGAQNASRKCEET
jgi:hypothetical protein